MRLVLIGDGQSPHLLKWARALAPRVELWAVSSRGFDAGFDALVPPERRLALGTTPRFEGGNAGLLRALPTVVRWLKAAQPDWLAPHYLTSHGTLAWLAVCFGGVKARIAGSAWGSDILLTPQKNAGMRWLTRRVLRACALTTSDSRHMAERMRALGAREVMTFPFGLEALPPWPEHKDDALFFANRALEALYRPERVLEAFAAIAQDWPEARLVVAHDGALRPALEARAAQPDLAGKVQFVGRLDAATQAGWYARARWYLSLPASDSVSVSVLEAMGHGCIPILSDLPANRELVDDGRNGVILAEGELPTRARLAPLAAHADAVGADLQEWVGLHALFPDSVQAYVQRLEQLGAAGHA
ncbi:glycosyltransferase [Ideonella dechloratans]|uniref:glycosyltransferase n=1 Tax=Ideonella dechloratans TaxID=36863 RepID=UPI001E2ED865|nr:glycosyltransferase [Ideonella dechloratans]UFU11092.1 glycosyltransferase [Ideonella dechloratans]